MENKREEFRLNNIKVLVFTDDNEFLNSYNPNYKELDKNELPANGFSNLDKNTIILLWDSGYRFEDLLDVISHEYGHIIEGGFEKNPEKIRAMEDEHEEKAEHYQEFVMNSYRLSVKIFNFYKLKL